METPSKEALYDTLIAPRLLEIGKLCQDNALGFVAAVEYEPFSIGRTASWPEDSSLAIRLVDVAAKAHGNVDSLIWAIMRYARENGHSSACLHILGVPEKPAAT